jgi:hypothetical protein
MMRSWLAMEISLMGTALEWGENGSCFPGELMISSAYVFHSPQAGQRPSHFVDSAPQWLQNQAFFTLLIMQR